MKRVTFTFTGTVDPAQEHATVYLTTKARDDLLSAMKEHGIKDPAVQVSVFKPKADKAIGAAA